jgi:hypothetical protein
MSAWCEIFPLSSTLHRKSEDLVWEQGRTKRREGGSEAGGEEREKSIQQGEMEHVFHSSLKCSHPCIKTHQCEHTHSCAHRQYADPKLYTCCVLSLAP